MNNQKTLVYAVYDNRTDLPVIIDGLPWECADAMCISENAFWGILWRYRKPSNGQRQWTMLKCYLDENGEGEYEE